MIARPPTLSEILDLDSVEETFNHFSALTGLAIRLTDAEGRAVAASSPALAEEAELCRLVQETEGGCARCARAFADGGREGARWGTPFFFNCWLGLLEWTVPLLAHGQVVGVLVCGQVLMKEADAPFREKVLAHCAGLGVDQARASNAMGSIRPATPQQCRAAAELLQLLANQLNTRGEREIAERRQQTEQQRRIAEAIHWRKDFRAAAGYPIDLENQLIASIRLGEIARAKQILNDLLGAIFFRDMANDRILKARLIELLAILSRAAVEAGGQIEETLGANLIYLQQINEAASPEQMGTIVIEALDQFTRGVYEPRNTDQLRLLSDALAYIREHACGQLSIEDAAHVSHRNSSTLRKLFHDQLGTTFNDYLNRVRVERAIELLKDPNKSLAEIAVEVGFYDQSHFGKIFRQVTGYTPALYRKKAL